MFGGPSNTLVMDEGDLFRKISRKKYNKYKLYSAANAMS